MTKKQKRRLYKDVAQRMVSAVDELNAALREAAEHPQVRVYAGWVDINAHPFQMNCEVTRITGHVVKDETPTTSHVFKYLLDTKEWVDQKSTPEEKKKFRASNPE